MLHECVHLPAQITASMLGRDQDDCQWECDGELNRGSNATPQHVAGELLEHANCGGERKSSRWERGKAPVLVSGAGHDALAMSEVTKVCPSCMHLPARTPLPASSGRVAALKSLVPLACI
jgi:hypothetical protein